VSDKWVRRRTDPHVRDTVHQRTGSSAVIAEALPPVARSLLIIPAAAARRSTGKRNHADPEPNRRPRREPAAARWATRGAGAPAPAQRRGAVRSGGGRLQPRAVHDGA
jgi:hypothetical protein